MTAYAWDIEADTAKEIISADPYRSELVVQLHAQAVEATDPVFLGFGEDATTETGLLLGGVGHTVRILGAKARLAVSAISAAISSGGIETHTSLEYQHPPNYPTGQLPPAVSAYDPVDGSGDVAPEYPFVITFDRDVQAVAGNIVIHKVSDDSIFDTIAIETFTTIDGATVSFSIPGMVAFTSYYILVASGVVESVEGIDWAGISSKTEWNFQVVPPA